MSQQNVDLVRALQPDPGTDLVALFRDQETWEGAKRALTPIVSPDFECAIVFPGMGGSATARPGLEGLRAAWLDWLEPWETYKVDIEEVIDAGDQVVVVPRDHGRLRGAEIAMFGLAVWTVRDGKIARVVFYASREEGLAAAGVPT